MSSLAAASPADPSLTAPAPTVSRLRMWLGLVALAAVGLLGSAPFFAKVLPAMVASQKAALPFTAGQILLLQSVQSLMLAALAAAIGVWTAPRVGLDAPLVRARLAGQPVARRLLGLLPLSLLAGTVSSAALLVLSLAMRSRLPAGGEFPPMSPWIAATSAFYGGILEELLTRWALLAAVALALVKLGLGRGPGFWVANVVAALLFGASHLPAAHKLGMSLTPLVLAYLLIANGLVGLVCGWLFRRRGLESAMLAHGSADLWLHAVFPVLGL